MKKGIKVFFKVFLIAMLIGGLLVTGVFIAGCFGLFTSDSDFDLSAFDMNLTSVVCYVDENGDSHELEQLYESQNRIWVDINQIPTHMQNAIVSIEDERFFNHNGVDFPRTAKAFLTYATKGSSSFGGSTITQQLVKNITNDKDSTPARKVREMWRAMDVERKYSKQQILELYLNTIFLANNCNGVQSAAKKYFGKDVSELTLAECASIAGITQYPVLYDPIANPEKNVEKQRLVLAKMLELGKITSQEYDNALAEELSFQNTSLLDGTGAQSYFVDMVINDVINDLQTENGYSKAYAERLVYNGGLKIYATIDPNIQSEMEKAYNDTSNFPKVSGKTTPQSAMLILDPYTGAILGTVGGIGEKPGDRVLNRATQSYRQPGSTIKPIGVYAPAIELGIISPGSLVLDSPIDINGWKPSNYYQGYKGKVIVRNAVEQSMNTPAVRVLQEVGVDYSFSFLTNKLGLTSLVSSQTGSDGKVYSDKNLSSLALGGLTKGLSAVQLASSYTPFVNKGLYSAAYSYTKVIDSTGKTILQKKSSPTVAMSEQTAFLTHTMLKSVVDNGSGQVAKLPCGMPSGGKTGTTDDQNDRWYIGYTPYYIGVVWYGYDQPQSLSFLNANPCTPVWKKVMNEISKNQPKKDFSSQPSGVSTALICLESGKLATSFCTTAGAKTSNEYFITSKFPTESCDIHKEEKAPEESPSPTESPLPSESQEPNTSPATTAPTPNSSVSPAPGAISPKPSSSPTPHASPPVNSSSAPQ